MPSYTPDGMFTLVEAPWNELKAPLQAFQSEVEAAINAITPGGTAGVVDPGASGIVVRTSLGTSAARNLIEPTAGFTIANSDGTGGNPTFSLNHDLAALEALTGTGFARRTGVDAWAIVSIVAGDLPGSFSGFSNPSAQVGLSAVNGSATTAMRSDAAPALSQSISPTMTGSWRFNLPIGLWNTAPVSNAGLTMTNAAISGGGYGMNVSVGGSDDADVAWFGGRFASNWSGSGSSFHAAVIGVTGYASHSGSGRVDFGQGSTGEFYHSGTGHVEQPFGAWNSVTINGSGTVGAAVGTYSRIFNAGTHTGGSMTSGNPSALFHGQFWQSTLATQPFSAIAGLRLSDWIKGAGSGAIGTSYAIYIDNSTNIGTVPYCIYSTSTAPSLLTGDLVAPSLTMGTTAVSNNPLRIIKTLSNTTSAYGAFVQVTNASAGAFQGIAGGHFEAILASSSSGSVTGIEARATTNAGLSSISHTGLDILNTVTGAPSSVYQIFSQVQLAAGSSVNNTYGLFTDVAYFTSGVTAFAYGTYTKFRGFGTITGGVGTAIGHYLGAWGTTGITNGYGLYIDSTSVDRATGTKWAIYSLATAASKFSGQIQGTSLTLTTPLAGAYGGTGSQYVTFAGPTSPRTYTLIDANASLLDGPGSVQSIPVYSGATTLTNSNMHDDGTQVWIGSSPSYPALTVDYSNWIVGLGDVAARSSNTYILVDDSSRSITMNAITSIVIGPSAGVNVTIAAGGGVINIDGANNSGFATDGAGSTWMGDWNGVSSATYVQVDDNSATISLRASGAFLTFDGGTLASNSALNVSSAGNLTANPAGNFIFSTSGKHIDPAVNYDQNLGQLSKKYLTIHAAELWVETLVAQNTIATIGGRILVGPTTQLILDLTAVATTIDVKHNQMTNGDRVYMEANGNVEFFAVVSGPTTITGGYRYSVTRNLDGSGANSWSAGDAVFNTGQTGSGFIDLYSVRGVKNSSQTGPTIVGNIRNSSTYNDWSEHWAIGNLNGLYGYGSNTPGIGLGQYASSMFHSTLDSTNGLRFYTGTTTVVGQWSALGVITVGQVAASQSNIIISSGALDLRNNTTARIHLASDGSGYLANSNISWDTSGNLTVAGSAVIAGWTINSASITSGGITLASSVTAANNKIFVGTGTYNNTNTAFYVDGAGKFSLKDRLTWDGTTLGVDGSGIFSGTVTALALRIGSFDNMVADGGFEQGPTNTQWVLGAGHAIASGSGINHSGTYGLNCPNTNETLWSAYFDCKPGDKFYAEGYVTATGGAAGKVFIRWYDASKSTLSTSNGSGQTGGLSTLVGTAPASAVYCRLGFSGAGTPGWFLDEVYMRRMIEGSVVVDGTITATKLTVTTLSAITASMGALTIDNLLTMNGASGAITMGDPGVASIPTNATTGTGIWIDRTVLAGLAASKQTFTLSSSTGVLKIGSDLSAAATTAFIVAGTAVTYNSESLGAGDIIMGDNSSSKANVRWHKSTGQLEFRTATTVHSYIDTDGAFKAGGGNVVLNSSGLSLAQGTGTSNKIIWGTRVQLWGIDTGSVSAFQMRAQSVASNVLANVQLWAENSTASQKALLDIRGDGLNSAACIAMYGTNFSGLTVGAVLTGASAFMLDVQGTMRATGSVRFSNYGAGTATFDASGNITSSSDERLKIIHEPFTRGLESIRLLRPIMYSWRRESGMETDHWYPGFTTQNVGQRDAIPEAVFSSPSGYDNLYERGIVATIVNGLRELDQIQQNKYTEFISLRLEVDELKNEVSRLTALLTERENGKKV